MTTPNEASEVTEPLPLLCEGWRSGLGGLHSPEDARVYRCHRCPSCAAEEKIATLEARLAEVTKERDDEVAIRREAEAESRTQAEVIGRLESRLAEAERRNAEQVAVMPLEHMGNGDGPHMLTYRGRQWVPRAALAPAAKDEQARDYAQGYATGKDIARAEAIEHAIRSVKSIRALVATDSPTMQVKGKDVVLHWIDRIIGRIEAGPLTSPVDRAIAAPKTEEPKAGPFAVPSNAIDREEWAGFSEEEQTRTMSTEERREHLRRIAERRKAIEVPLCSCGHAWTAHAAAGCTAECDDVDSMGGICNCEKRPPEPAKPEAKAMTAKCIHGDPFWECPDETPAAEEGKATERSGCEARNFRSCTRPAPHPGEPHLMPDGKVIASRPDDWQTLPVPKPDAGEAVTCARQAQRHVRDEHFDLRGIPEAACKDPKPDAAPCALCGSTPCRDNLHNRVEPKPAAGEARGESLSRWCACCVALTKERDNAKSEGERSERELWGARAEIERLKAELAEAKEESKRIRQRWANEYCDVERSRDEWLENAKARTAERDAAQKEAARYREALALLWEEANDPGRKASLGDRAFHYSGEVRNKVEAALEAKT